MHLIRIVAALRNFQCNVCLRKIKTLCRHALFEFLSGRIGSSGAHKRTLVAGKKELNFESARRQQFFVQVSCSWFHNRQEVLDQKSPQVIDHIVFNYLVVDNAGQTVDNKHTGSMIFPFFLLASKTDKPLGDDTCNAMDPHTTDVSTPFYSKRTST